MSHPRFATYRIDRHRATTGRLAALLTALLVGGSTLVASEAADSFDANAAQARLAALAGTWTGELDGQPMTVVYRAISKGQVVMETLFPGTDLEMVTMYHRDGDDLVLTHYCDSGNQPRMRLASASADQLVFAFTGVGNLAPGATHMHDGAIRFVDADHIVATWNAWGGDRPAGSLVFELTRSSGAPAAGPAASAGARPAAHIH